MMRSSSTAQQSKNKKRYNMKKIFTILTATAIGLLSYFLIAQADTNQITYSEKFINNLTKCTPISESSTVKTPYYTTVNGQKELKGYLNTYINFWIQGKKEGKCMFFTIKRTTPVPQGDEYKMLRLTSTARIECLLTPEEQQSMAEKLRQYNQLSDRTQISTDPTLCKVYVFLDNKWVDFEKIDPQKIDN